MVEHETDEVLGTGSCISTQSSPLSDVCDSAAGASAGHGTPSAVDLYRYSAAGSLILDSSLSTATGAYFSYNGGSTDGAVGSEADPKYYNTLDNGADYADFALVSPCGPNESIQDAYGCPGADGGLTILNDGGAEVNILNAIGYQEPVSLPVSLGVANVCPGGVGPSPCSQSATVTLQFTAAETGISPSVVTQGATGLDFTDAGGGTCDTNGTGHAYNPEDTCTVNVKFAPKVAGARDGAVKLVNGSSTVVATTFIYGTGQGPQLAFGPPATPTTLGGGFSGPAAVAVDGSGNVYIADGYPANAVKEMPAGCTSSSCVTTLGGGFNSPSGVAVDGAGNIYLADTFNNAVKVMPPGCTSSSCVTTLGGGFSYPEGVAVDGSGNVYVADNGNNAVKEMPPGCASSGCVTTLGAGFSAPQAVAVDGSGNVYVADYNNNAVKKMTPGCTSSGCVTTLGGGFDYPAGVAVDGGGNVYVANYQDGSLDEMPPGCSSSSCVVTLRSGFGAPTGLMLDGSGNLYVADFGNDTVDELPLATPPSLSFASTNVGSQSSDSPQSVTLRNIGNASLTFPVPGTGENPSISANFTLDGSTTCPQVLSSGSAGTLASGASCNLAVDFIPTTSGSITGSVVATDNSLNASNATQSIGLSGTGATSTPIVPYIQVNGGAWTQESTATVNVSDTVNLGPQPVSGGTWSWTGPNGFSSTSRVLYSIPLAAGTNTYTATYTNTSGGQSTQAFTITVNTPIVPYIQV
ncbi:MAG: choice-of-anchor D domain-containing protein, partial [Acidobacteriaceae bacterium]